MRRTRYARSGDLNIAYQFASEGAPGSPDIVLVDGMVSHCDLDWEITLYRRTLEQIGSMGRLLRFDKRGTGCSDRDLGYGSPEDRMDDIRAVMDAAGVERAVLIGVSEGGPLSVLFAATYPERVEKLVLYGSYCCQRRDETYPWGTDDEEHRAGVERMEKYWGTGLVMAYLSGLEVDDRRKEALARYERACASPGTIRQISDMNRHLDVRSVLGVVSVPTLVLHHPEDHAIPCDAARWMAAQIPGAVFREAPGVGVIHISSDHETWDIVHEFITGSTRQDQSDRVLMTVLFTDIVSSTERAAAAGDAAWTRLLDDHDARVRACVESHRGRVVKTTGDGVLATFDGPARGVRCAIELHQQMSALGLEIRAGLHTGECIQRGDDIAGMAVHIAARVGARAASGDVLVTSTVRDLVIGSGLEFTERDVVELKGVPGTWQLHACV